MHSRDNRSFATGVVKFTPRVGCAAASRAGRFRVMRSLRKTQSGAAVSRLLVTGVAASLLAIAAIATGSSADPLRVLEVRATPHRLTLDPNEKRASYRLYATNADTVPSGTVRLCARKWPHGRLRLVGERCEAFASLEPGDRTDRAIRFRVLDRARGKLSEVRLRVRGPEVQPAATTVLLKVRRRPAPPPDPYPY
jgi:hypothetical protein